MSEMSRTGQDSKGCGGQSGVSGKKCDSGKEPMVQGLLAYFGRALRGVAAVSAYGAQKYSVPYSDQNWRRVDNAKGRYADALVRHLEAYSRGEMIDQESGKPHVDMMAWNALALSELEKGGAQEPALIGLLPKLNNQNNQSNSF